MAALHRGFSPSSFLLLLLLLVSRSLASQVHEILTKYGFPRASSPTLPSTTCSSPMMTSSSSWDPCYVKFTDLVYYDKTIRGKLEFGRISDLSGIQVKKLFAWLPITGIIAPPNKGHVEFQVRFLSEVYPVKMFEKIPSCRAKAGRSFRGAESLPISKFISVKLLALNLDR
ncbi:hypothetical protein J5N97_020244 [Dioscorea zingiberensis]|uniref:Uncharacterized protein n=1 Tax=Dioscorea zingiberensis TaxID=325984 RepID=A0A9D5HDG5_9LILI|nr:hypothetical protein J5N97_020244 [Dioscorea zingiberensis]